MKTIEISHRTIIFTVFFLIGLWVVWQIKSVALALFIAFLLATALNPLVNQLTRLRLPRALAILLVYLLLIGSILGVAASLIPPLVDQTSLLAARLPDYLTTLGGAGIDQKVLSEQLANIGKLPANVLQFTVSLFSNIVSVFIVLVLSFYILLERGSLDTRLLHLFGRNEERVKLFIGRTEKRLGSWVRGELILMTIIGLITYIGLRLLGMHFALPLALLAGLLEIVPTVGPIVSAVPAVIVGFTISPVMGFSVAALYFLVQQLENSFIAPKVMQKSVGLPPLATLIALAVGAELGGIMGATLAVPLLLVFKETFFEFAKDWKLLG
ncbi:AI-2E family transporter [Candidatus Microgenomates bacterium]|nr:AI-2E family transporter [Candidatus Microgenomates bacterium]